jgi:hypothetical protein
MSISHESCQLSKNVTLIKDLPLVSQSKSDAFALENISLSLSTVPLAAILKISESFGMVLRIESVGVKTVLNFFVTCCCRKNCS